MENCIRWIPLQTLAKTKIYMRYIANFFIIIIIIIIILPSALSVDFISYYITCYQIMVII